MELRKKEVLANRYGIGIDEVVDYQVGEFFNNIRVATKEAAERVSAAVKDRRVIGGWLDGMALGNITRNPYGGYYQVMC